MNPLAMCFWSFCSAAFFVFTGGSSAAQDSSFDVMEASISEIQDALKSGQTNCQQLLSQYLKRIETYERSTNLNSLTHISQHAAARARELDETFKSTGKLLPLQGVFVVAKDNYDTHDMPTAGGSILLKDSIPPDDAFQIKRLREAGAIILCKSNMAEFAYSPNFSISSVLGETRNPYGLEYVPAGSSGGTAAAVAVSFGTVGLGTDTGNSIRGPSSHCALVGIRPTLGRTSRDGIIPLFLRNDVGGPMCRTVEDAAKILEIISGDDAADPVTELVKTARPFSYRACLNIDGLRGKRIGVLKILSQRAGRDREIAQLFETACDKIGEQGGTVVAVPESSHLTREGLFGMQARLWRDTFRHDIEVYLASLGQNAPIKTLDDIIESGNFDATVRDRLQASRNAPLIDDLDKPYSANPLDDPLRTELLESVLEVMDELKLDALIFPTWNNPPRKIGDFRTDPGNNCYQIAPHTGQPAVTVPMGFTEAGLPAGLQILGRPFDEATIVEIAYAYEQATKHRRPPKNFPALDD